MDQQTTSPGFGQRLIAAGHARGRLCVGIDPHPHLLSAWSLPVSAEGVREFSRICVEAFADTAALVKPQVAFYERFGAAGFAALEETLADLRSAGCLTLADAKRGDIGSTMAGYAQAWLGDGSRLLADALTVSPYLGVAALEPVFDVAASTGRGVFVLAATSNPEARTLQSATIDSEASHPISVAQSVVDECAARNAKLRTGESAGEAASEAAGESLVGNIGVVIGATVEHPPVISELNGPVLLPGVGTQGGGVEDVAKIMNAAPHLGFANVSRAVLSAGPKVDDLRETVKRVAGDLSV